jgi:hypothetical protein
MFTNNLSGPNRPSRTRPTKKSCPGTTQPSSSPIDRRFCRLAAEPVPDQQKPGTNPHQTVIPLPMQTVCTAPNRSKPVATVWFAKLVETGTGNAQAELCPCDGFIFNIRNKC